MNKTIAFMMFLSVSGCATITGYDSKVASMKGKPEVDVIREWGAPNQVYESGPRKFLTYSTSRIVSMPGMAPSYTTTMIGNTAHTNRVGGFGGMSASKSCVTTFEIVEGYVASSSYKGNGCRSW